MRLALVVIDMQRAFLDDGASLHPDRGDALELIEYVAGVFREHGHTVVWVHDVENLTPDDPGFELVEGLEPQDGDVRVHKIASNAFMEDGLPAALADTETDFALFCGYRAEQCVLATARGAADHEFPHALLRGAVLSPDAEAVRFVERLAPLASHEVAVALAQAGG